MRRIISALLLGAFAACSPSSSTQSDSGAPDSSVADTAAPLDAALDGPTPTTTIADARQSFADAGTGPAITVNAIVTAVQGPPGDQVIWYVEDPNGGPYSGISVFCDPLAAKTCPCKASCSPNVAAPPLHTLVSISGTITAYHGQLQLEPTAQTILQANASPPPTYTATTNDLAETGNSPYRGVYVKFPTTVTVDNLTPTALYDSQCNTGSTDGGMPLCAGCTPPTYAGFEVNNAFYVEETFFPFVPLASSPECVSQSGAVAVTNNETFPMMAGILDIDPYAGVQALSPVQPSDYGQ